MKIFQNLVRFEYTTKMVLHSNRYESMFIISLKNCARYSKLILNDKFLKMSDFPIINPQKHLFSFMWIYQHNNRLGINIKKNLGIFFLHRFHLGFFKGFNSLCMLVKSWRITKTITWDILKNKTYIVSLIRYIT